MKNSFLESKGFKSFMAKAYGIGAAVVSIGAAVVIFGAWAKILHKSYADFMLTVGLLTEAAIFIIYAFYHPKDPLVDLGKTLENGLGKKRMECFRA
jgi:hypothetical protein